MSINHRRAGLLLGLIGASVWMQHQQFLTFISYPLLLMSTIPHELGHGIAAVLVGHKFTALELHSNGAGTAFHQGASSGLFGAFSQGFISAAGLVGPAFAAAVGFWGARHNYSNRLLWALSTVLALTSILVGRGLFTHLFLWFLAACFGLCAKFLSPERARIAIAFASVQLGLSVFSRSDYLFMQYASPGQPSDVQQIANNLLLPYWFWGIVCALVSVLVLGIGLWGYVAPQDQD
jgi:hypothetical protein